MCNSKLLFAEGKLTYLVAETQSTIHRVTLWNTESCHKYKETQTIQSNSLVTLSNTMKVATDSGACITSLKLEKLSENLKEKKSMAYRLLEDILD